MSAEELDLEGFTEMVNQLEAENACRALGATDEDINALRRCMEAGTPQMYVSMLWDACDELKRGERRILDAARNVP